MKDIDVIVDTARRPRAVLRPDRPLLRAELRREEGARRA